MVGMSLERGGNMLKTVVRKTKYGFKGYIVCYCGKTRLWSESAGLDRICWEDALEDAEWLKRDRENTWETG